MDNILNASSPKSSIKKSSAMAHYKPEKNSYSIRDYYQPEKDMSIEERISLAREAGANASQLGYTHPLQNTTPYYIRNNAAPHDINDDVATP